ncbi:MAG: AlkA N-terminal domain-containing protein [Synergistota bacterium]|jgi:AraC family transcriptional regulator of adaptative response / DNA-3-methyladenine glycosylase II|nr:AlkA N-terminal domain-containing protein [Synergistota bacterium]OPZ40565.1 MAG: DNA-3-methyladenine glycosylase 2 [Synergistetes bacterium ADurb.BinA166]
MPEAEGRAMNATPLDGDALYEAFGEHDSSLDGRVFVGVSSTGVYCRPTCRARRPARKNCSFFPSAAAAEEAGFRPCLKCRPEHAPGLPSGVNERARRGAILMDEMNLEDGCIATAAAELGISAEELDSAFVSAFGVPADRFLATRRLLLARSLLLDTYLPIDRIFEAAGFASFSEALERLTTGYRMRPGSAGRGRDLVLYLGYRPPYRWDWIISFLADRAIPGVEVASSEGYGRTVRLRRAGEEHRGWVSVANDARRNRLAVGFSPSLLPVLPRVLARIRGVFDLDCDPAAVTSALARMNDDRPGSFVPGARLPGCFDPFETAVRTILGQQITVKAARTLASRLVASYGEEVDGCDGLDRAFPAPEVIAALGGEIEDRLGSLGVTGARSRSIRALATGLVDGGINLSRSATPEAEMARLLKLPGFGPWTVHCLAMRVFGWTDAFPHTDYGVRKALGGLSDREILALGEEWRPWRSYAVINLWNAAAAP